MKYTALNSSLQFYRDQEDYLRSQDIQDIMRFIKTYYRLIILSAVIALSIGVAYVMRAPPSFTAHTQLLIDPATSQILRERIPGPDATLDTAKLESQIAVLRSETIVESVIKRLNLLDDPDFQPQPPGLLPKAMSYFSTSPAKPESKSDDFFLRSRIAIGIFQSSMDAARLGTSYAVDISFTSRDPKKAAVIANAIAAAYIGDQIQAASKAAKQSSEWLEERLEQLRSQLNVASRQVQLFKSGQNFSSNDQRAPRNASVASAIGRDGVSPTDAVDLPPASTVPLQTTIAELESQAANYKKIYETYLQAFTDAVQRQSFPVANARTITLATEPLSKSYPKTGLIILLSLLSGTTVGIASAFVLQSVNDRVTTGKQLEDRLGVACLAQIPKVGSSLAIKDAPQSSLDPSGGPFAGWKSGAGPYSPFTNALKYVRTAIEVAQAEKGARTFGFISALPQEGKSTISLYVAALLSSRGARVLLLDLDLHKASLTKALGKGAEWSLLDVLSGKVDTAAAIVRSERANVPDFIPLRIEGAADISYDIFSSPQMREFLQQSQDAYDYILLDMPPMRPVVDVIAIASTLDGVVLIAEWNVSPMQLLEEAMHRLKIVHAKVLGVVMTKVNQNIVKTTWRRERSYYR